MTYYVSNSKVNDWRTCHKKFEFKHEEKIQRKKRSRPLKFGGIVHKMHEADAAGQDPFDKLAEINLKEYDLFESEREEYGNIVDDIRYIMRGYYAYYEDEPLILVPYKKRRAEHPFEVDIAKGITCKGTIDAVSRMKKKLWLTEHKNHKSFPSAEHRWRNLQTVVYFKINELTRMFEPFEGTLWDFVRTKVPTRPQLLKSGKMSERELDTLPEVIVDTIKGHGLDPRAYKSLVDTATANMANWYERVYTPVKPFVVKRVWEDFVTTAKEMATSKDRTRNIGRHCDWCEFEPLCRAFWTGGDFEFLMKYEYEPAEYDLDADNR